MSAVPRASPTTPWSRAGRRPIAPLRAGDDHASTRSLIVAAIYYLIPLYVMIVTSLKGLEEVRLGNIFAPPLRDHLRAVGQGVGLRLHRPLLRGAEGRLLQLGLHHRAERHRLDRRRLGQRLRAGQLALQGIGVLLHRPARRVVHPLPGVALSAGASSPRRWASTRTLYAVIMVHTIFGMPVLTLLFRNYFASLPVELFKAARVDGAGFWGVFFRIMLPMSLPIFSVAIILQVTGIWNDFLFGLVFAGQPNYPMTVQLNNIVNSIQGVREYNVNMAATILTGLVPLTIYFVSGQAVRARHRRRRGEGLNRWRSVSIRKLGVAFGNLKVLEDLDLEVEEGEFIVLLGPSGCGKSTLLNAIAGLLDIDAGQIWIGGKNVTWEEPKDRGIGMVFQSYALYPRMTAEGNLTFGLKIARVPKRGDRAGASSPPPSSCRSSRS